ncbi:trihelix transcription factor DF1-like [Telopea speciosissima]|uniref:trihelix transcription factor DF1-like n=1 Tax=Telopea speciosissima TaxID=54955 RepID=UPI001CC6C676|nr:trihelix transcription factor DF1-like [Telopea speciosissima]
MKRERKSFLLDSYFLIDLKELNFPSTVSKRAERKKDLPFTQTMFNGIPDQFYQFIDSRTPLTLPLPLSLPLHVSPPNYFSVLDPPSSHPHQQQHQQQQFIFQSHPPLLHHHHHHHHHQLHQQSPTVEDDEDKEEQEQEAEEREAVGRSMELLGLNLKPFSSQITDPWTEEEILALWRIRSSIQSGFTDFIWEHISRNLAELGFKRSAEKCKEKYEEVSKYCNATTTTTTTSYSKNFRSFNELEALYEGVNPNHSAEKEVVMSDEGVAKMKLDSEENSGNETLVNPTVEKECVTKNSRTKKRKRHHKLQMLKSFCEEIVNKIMVQQEELQNKLLQDMEKREEEKIAREEAWRKQEMARMDREIELKAHLQEIACDREATVIEILKNLGSTTPTQFQNLFLKNKDLPKTLNSSQNPKVPTSSPQNPSSLPNPADVPSSSTVALNVHINTDHTKVPSSSCTPNLTSKNHDSLVTQENTAPQNPNYTSSTDREDHGKRWPRNEVYSLINLRCSLYSSGEDKEGSKVPLWERISQGMLELGFNRSAKRCKEKWENINKYFRKTRDANKKRSSDSKTCPYFHQLSSFYNQGKLVINSEGPENHSTSPENRSEQPVNTNFRSPDWGFKQNDSHVDEDHENNLEFE